MAEGALARFVAPGTPAEAGAFAWSPDGTLIAALATLQRRAVVIDPTNGRELARIDDLAGGGDTIAFAADNRVLLPPHHDPTAGLTVWDPVRGHAQPVPGPAAGARNTAANMLSGITLDRSRNRLAGLYQERRANGTTFQVAIYDAHRWALLGKVGLSATRVSLSPDGQRLAAAAAGAVIVRSLDGASGDRTIDLPSGRITGLAWSNDDRRLAIGLLAPGAYIDAATGRHLAAPGSVTLALCDVESARVVATNPTDLGGQLSSLDFSGDGRWLATTSSDRTCRLWNADDLSPGPTVAKELAAGTAITRFRPDSRALAILESRPAIFTLHAVPSEA